ncbi:ribosylglycohydrolase [Mycobacterium sp. Root135]|uniref:ADP-ribosylglycohydrolase family protein n=1 Tax=Mycobacterium sp. Root135 TaxID=1736457 RepID=UPI0006F97A8B|nr:ADP-ribosylglycohydrolase family protein [Mycobacterium sp. Root135]KQY03397.1 ribosylglycohydrolase [Mycobacterium sp. Root135]
MEYTNAQLDRAEGVLLGTAAGDALGAPYEFQPARGPEESVAMVGGGVFDWEPGEWTDDTSMAIAIAEVAANTGDLLDEESQNALLQGWHGWMKNAKDIGVQTSSVLRTAGWMGIGVVTARNASKALHDRTGHTAGNGSLMRTAPVALAYLDDEFGLVEAARAISELTHFDPEAGDACVLWCCAIRRAVLTGELDVRFGLHHIPEERRQTWIDRLDLAEKSHPSDFPNNGWVVSALQAAWSAISTTPVPVEDPASGTFRADHLRLALDAAVRAGNDTDTVAAIAGGLLGAAYGASAIPAEWRRVLHGWPGLDSRGVIALARAVVIQGEGDEFDPNYPGHATDVLVRHPYDDGLWLGGVGILRDLPRNINAVVSLCRVGDDDVPHGIPHVQVRLIDGEKPDENPNLDFVLFDAATTVARLRQEGRTVLLHCVAAFSRTPTVAALYGARLQGVSIDEALSDVTTVLAGAYPNLAFRAALRRLHVV